jgi:hypothetical protein
MLSRGSQCRPAARASADLGRAAPSRKHTQARAAPFRSRADHRKPTRRAPARVRQFRHHARWHPHRNAYKGRMSPAQAAPSPLKPAASAQRPSAAARAPREPVHTSQPLASVRLPASPRPTPRRARKSRAEPQAHPDARRTYHDPRGPPETDEERARGVLHSFECHVTWHPAPPQYKGKMYWVGKITAKRSIQAPAALGAPAGSTPRTRRRCPRPPRRDRRDHPLRSRLSPML